MTANQHFVVIGAGHAGGIAVQAFRNFGHKGPITLIGEEPNLPYERPQLSKDLLHSPNENNFQLIRDTKFYNDANISVLLKKSAKSIDVKSKIVLLDDGESVGYDRLLLTTGGKPRIPNIPGMELDGIFTLRTIEDCRAIENSLSTGAKVLVVGGGFIGLEVAASARMRGAEVTVLEVGPSLMSRSIPTEISDIFYKLHTENNVRINLEQGVQEFLGKGHVDRVKTTSGEEIEIDLVIIGIGILPETALAQSAQLKINNGILVNEYCCTSDRNIFAAGDNTNHFSPMLGRHIRLEAWLNAQDQALAAARNMCNEVKPYNKVPWMWTDQFNVNLQIAGAPVKWDRLRIRGDISKRDFIAFQFENSLIKAALSVNRQRDMRVARRMISAQAKFSEAEVENEKISLRNLLKRAKD